MSRPLEGITVIEVAMWAFVPSAGGILADMGATVIKVEPPSGDPLRGLQTGIGAASSVDYSWESYNRGKRSVTLDLKQPAGRDVLYKLIAGCDVFLTSLLPPARKAMGIDADTLRARFPALIYASGSASGTQGPDAEKGGYDAITFWARGGISASVTPDDHDRPIGPPGPAFGDTMSGAMLAGGICAAIAKRALTGEASSVDVSLLSSAIWTMQRPVAQATDQNVERLARPPANRPNNVLSYTYRTADDRFVALCMLQADRYWKPFCLAAGRTDLADDPRFADARARRDNGEACLAKLEALFASKTLAEWRDILGRQDGQWDAVQQVGELAADRQVVANGLIQQVAVTAGRPIPLVSAPMQFDGAPLTIAAAPDIGADSDAILTDLGYSQDAIIDLKIAGIVF